jgi:soluble lytic murein transglycosylase
LRTLWSWAWSLRQSGEIPAAIEKISELLDEDASTPGQARARFWRARWRKLIDDKRFTEDFDWILEQDPTGYYGLITHRELNRSLPPLRPIPATGVESAVDQRPLDVLRLWSESLALPYDIELGARSLASQMNAPQETSRTEFERLARLGSWAPAIEHFGRVSGVERAEWLKTSADLLFPRPWAPVFSRSAKDANLPVELLYSISRQESSFRPNARSSADAMGLMQLLPMNAERLSKQHSLPYKSADELAYPEINVPLAARLVRELLDMHDGNFVLAVASYNASERYVRRWVERRLSNDALEFIEEIPFEETRGYVRLVIRNYTHYLRQLRPDTGLVFPEWCLQAIQPSTH